MNDKLQEIMNESSIRTTIFENSYIVEIRKESFDYLIKQAEKAERFRKALSIYAHEQNYERTLRMMKWALIENEERYGDYNPSFVEVDRGKLARKALAGDSE